ncbi:ferrous iron transport protein A [Fictibacillus sp. WQ 8-8]|uniref:Ferrous iron transport protein A n=1 Tax=Fictibacillus marinisediminis TaxID=2878389 RepID=A0A9X1X815_9BACL|nr:MULTISPECIES: FeoA family protein [Fictibacillus]SFE25628.1 ferrous iron transport protein A [Bacillus sp. OV194]MCK6255782.1 ferrous iron transport protein A [Fictibacillus marinisediminis]MCQ6267119.1 ferrous iron transport protein A [Fictibacillus sp. WQ 8-8]MED2972104.1 FeoA family protein [Fictibacillus sp. B-59209]UZJ78284.1 ferrous iron transport protein A [Fictibacillus sp. KU28468]
MVLTDIRAGGKAKIINTELVNTLVRRRLLDLGIMEGTEIIIKRILPFGGPFAVEAGGQWVGIRRSEAKMIQVCHS